MNSASAQNRASRAELHRAQIRGVGRVSRKFSTAGGRELEAQSTPSCSFNLMPDLFGGSWPTNQTP
jgi:hypothetical protein